MCLAKAMSEQRKKDQSTLLDAGNARLPEMKALNVHLCSAAPARLGRQRAEKIPRAVWSDEIWPIWTFAAQNANQQRECATRRAPAKEGSDAQTLLCLHEHLGLGPPGSPSHGQAAEADVRERLVSRSPFDLTRGLGVDIRRGTEEARQKPPRCGHSCGRRCCERGFADGHRLYPSGRGASDTGEMIQFRGSWPRLSLRFCFERAHPAVARGGHRARCHVQAGPYFI